jgi:hypothetical protein
MSNQDKRVKGLFLGFVPVWYDIHRDHMAPRGLVGDVLFYPSVYSFDACVGLVRIFNPNFAENGYPIYTNTDTEE